MRGDTPETDLLALKITASCPLPSVLSPSQNSRLCSGSALRDRERRPRRMGGVRGRPLLADRDGPCVTNAPPVNCRPSPNGRGRVWKLSDWRRGDTPSLGFQAWAQRNRLILGQNAPAACTPLAKAVQSGLASSRGRALNVVVSPSESASTIGVVSAWTASSAAACPGKWRDPVAILNRPLQQVPPGVAWVTESGGSLPPRPMVSARIRSSIERIPSPCPIGARRVSS